MRYVIPETRELWQAQLMAAPLKPLNWREIEALVKSMRAELGVESGKTGQFVERVFVPLSPARLETPEGYLRHEWALRFSGRGRPERDFIFSLRPGSPWIALAPEKRLTPARGATQSPFSLAFQARVSGAKFRSIEALAHERTVIVSFSTPTSGENNPDGPSELCLAITLIPNAAEAFLFERVGHGKWTPGQTFALIARSRPNQPLEWTVPSPKPGASLELHHPHVGDWRDHFDWLESAIHETAFTDRADALRRHLRAQIKNLGTRLNQALKQESTGQHEPDWASFGDRLKTEWSMYLGESAQGKTKPWSERLKTLDLPIDPEFLGDRFADGFDAKSQLARYFSKARRSRARLAEASERRSTLEASLADAQHKLAELDPKEPPSTALVRRLERELGLRQGLENPDLSKAPKKVKAHAGWSGKTVTSKEGLIIRAGRNKTENLELTFKIARGNDLWLHLKGKPGSHVVITLPPGKSASLETLLDAAHLCIHYSGGTDWGKAEVDYTARKHVKRIKDSTEASYTQNKTLMVAIDRERIKRLLGSS